MVYVSYNRKMENRFKKIRELGSKGKRCNPLLLDEFHWENEWVNENQLEMEMEASILMLICLIRWLVAYFCWTIKLDVNVCDCVEHFSSLAYVY